jgi:dTDP-4-dehydrorhamnose 3,5-epimerase
VHSYQLHPLQRFNSKEGGTWRAIRSDAPGVLSIKETYFSWVNPGSIKAWKRHSISTCNFVVPVGNVEFVVHTHDEKFEEITIGVDNYQRLVVPPNTWFGFRGKSDYPCLVMNTMDFLHDDRESEKSDLNLFNYKWSEE